MATFTYSARTKAGIVQKGTLIALDRSAAAASLLDKGMVPILVKEQVAKVAGSGNPLTRLFGSRVKLQDKVIFTRQFATMINAGVPLAQSLAILQEQSESKALQAAVSDIAKQVQGGATLANALSSHPDIFNAIYVNMVRAGEAGGILDQVLERLATQQEKDAEIVSKIRSAMIYPSVVSFVTVCAFFFLMTVIVPKLASIFRESGAALPIYTQIMLTISDALVNYGVFLAIGAVIGGVAFVRWARTPLGKRVLDRVLIKLPILGPILVKVNVARFARTFGSLMAAGISVVEAVNATRSALGSSVYQDELDTIAREIKNGRPLSEQLKKSKNFPAIVGQMASVGEETGELDDILLKLAVFYEKEVDTVIEGLTSIIEPLLMVVLGGMVGFIVISVFGPISSISSSV